MATNENLIPIPGRLHSVATEGHVAGADEIYDDTQSKLQSTINTEVNTALGNTLNKTAQTLTTAEKDQVAQNLNNRPSTNGMARIELKATDNFKSVVEAQTGGNTIFVIKYDFTLTDNVTVPPNCILEFDGGSISGAYTLTGNDSILNGRENCIDANIDFDGTFKGMFKTSYINGQNYQYWNNVLATFDGINMDCDIIIDSTIIIPQRKVFIGNGKKIVTMTTNNICFKPLIDSVLKDVTISCNKNYSTSAIYIASKCYRVLVENIDIYFEQPSDSVTSLNSIGIYFHASERGGICFCNISNVYISRAHIAFNFYAEHNTGYIGWINSNNINRCVAYACRTAVKMDCLDSSDQITFNKVDVDFQNDINYDYDADVYDINQSSVKYSSLRDNYFSGTVWDIGFPVSTTTRRGSKLGNLGFNRQEVQKYLYLDGGYVKSLGSIDKRNAFATATISISEYLTTTLRFKLMLSSGNLLIYSINDPIIERSNTLYNGLTFYYEVVGNIIYLYVSNDSSGYFSIDLEDNIGFTLFTKGNLTSEQASSLINKTPTVSKQYLTNASGNSNARPTAGLQLGKQFYDKTLGKPIWWNGTAWIDATGTPV